MRWEELSMRDRSELMKTYLRNGVTQLSAMRNHYNKFVSGGPLRDEYDNPDQYYDCKTAEEVGNMYDPRTQHWASRDPRTGMILKNPKHPAFGMAIREDQSSGYAPFIDSSTGRYYTLRLEEYATAPNKITLRRVNKFDGNSTKTQSLRNPLGFDMFFDTPGNIAPINSKNSMENKENIDFTGIKTSTGRPYDPKLIGLINNKLSSLKPKQRASVLGQIIEESGGNPFAMSKDSTYQGLLQWGEARYRVPDYGPIPSSQDTITELNNQVEEFLKTSKNITDKKSWTHGGKGSRFSSGKQAHDTFWNENIPLDSVHRGLSFGYVRPKGKEASYRNRQKVVNQVYKKIGKK